jgi:hypothetical protein
LLGSSCRCRPLVLSRWRCCRNEKTNAVRQPPNFALLSWQCWSMRLAALWREINTRVCRTWRFPKSWGYPQIIQLRPFWYWNPWFLGSTISGKLHLSFGAHLFENLCHAGPAMASSSGTTATT